MKLEDLLESETEKSTPDKAPSTSGDMSNYVTTAQAANMCNCSMSRIRQFIMDGRVKVKSPVPGRRDNLFVKADIQAFCEKERERTGRPPKSVESRTDGKKDDKED